jgi:hypothetical protein
LWYTALGLGIPTASFLIAWGLHGSTASTYRIDSQWSALTGLFILALAIERALEPFSRKLGPDTAKRLDARDRALASLPAYDEEDNILERQSAVEMSRRLTAVITWGVATVLAFLLCAQLNITLLQAVRANGSGQPPFWATCWSPALSWAQAPSHCTTSSPTSSTARMPSWTRHRPRTADSKDSYLTR